MDCSPGCPGKYRESTNISSDSGEKMEPKCFVGQTVDGLPPISSVTNLSQQHEVVSESTSSRRHTVNCVEQEDPGMDRNGLNLRVVFFFLNNYMTFT